MLLYPLLKLIIMFYIILSVISLIAVVFIYIYRKEFWKGFVEAINLNPIKSVKVITKEDVDSMKDGDIIYEESKETYYKKKDGTLIEI